MTCRRHLPKNIRIVYEDAQYIIIDKPPGLLTVSTGSAHTEKTAYRIITDYVRKGNSKSRNRVWIVHRLDRDTSGLLMFCRDEKIRSFIQDNWQHTLKTYAAAVCGFPEPPSGTITSWLREDANHYMHVRPCSFFPAASGDEKTENGWMKVSLSYTLKELGQSRSLVIITPHTGKKNQIRAQFASIGCPVAGDSKYGIKSRAIHDRAHRLALHALSINFKKMDGSELAVQTKIPEVFFQMVRK